MESRNKSTMCRLCLCENESFIDIFGLNDQQGCVPAEVISDLCQFQVSETDFYPHVVCSTCLTKLTDFKLFKECCLKSKVVYDDKFASSEKLVKHHSEEVTIKSEEVIIDSSSYKDSEDPLIETEVRCGPILLKNEVLSFRRDSPQEEIIDSEVSGNEGIVESAAALMQDSPKAVIKQEELAIDCTSGDETEEPFKGFYSEDNLEPLTLEPEGGLIDSTEDDMEPLTLEPEGGLIDSTEVHLPLLETDTHPKYPHCLRKKRSHFTSKVEIEADSCICRIRTDDELIFEKTKNISLSEEVEASSSGTMERMELQKILPGDSMYMDPHLQQEKEGMRMKQDVGGDGESCRGTGQKKVSRERREGLECFHCGIVLMSKLGLIRHMKVHGFVNSYDCAECGKVFRFNNQFKTHLLTHTGSKLHKCKECGKCFSQSCNLKSHMRIHTGTKPYKCSECSKSFSKNGDLKRHMRSHTGSKPYKCAGCSKSFSQSSNLKTHMRLHTGSKPYKCAECRKSFSHGSNLKTHMRLHTGDKPYKCADCSKSFSQNGDLKKHMRTHTGSKPYKCEECGKCFSQSCNLQNHMTVHTGSKLYKCDKCSKRFRHSSSLKKHTRLHTGSKPYRCSDCSKSFSQSSNLTTHMRIHTGTKPYKCSECSKSFSQSCNLKNHMRLHTCYKPYKCADCSKSFSQSFSLKKHMRLHRLKTI